MRTDNENNDHLKHQKEFIEERDTKIRWYQSRWFVATRIMIVIVFTIIGALSIYKPNIKALGTNQEMSNETKQDIKNDLLFYSLVSDNSASNFEASSGLLAADDSFLEMGKTQKFKSEDLVGSIIGTDDYMGGYKMAVTPGVYTIKYSSKSDDDTGLYFNMGTSDGYQFYFDNEPHDYYMKEFQNVTVNDLITITALSNSQDQFKFKLIAQDEYVNFDSSDIKPGFYTGGVNLPVGEYSCDSAVADDTYIYVRNDEYDGNVNVNEVDSINIGEGDLIVIDDQNTILNKV